MVKENLLFRCKECSEIINQGKCGEHRAETGHEEFESVGDGNENNFN